MCEMWQATVAIHNTENRLFNNRKNISLNALITRRRNNSKVNMLTLIRPCILCMYKSWLCY